MKHFLILLIMISTFGTLLGQVGINNPNPDGTAILDLKATDKGLLIPRMNSSLRVQIGQSLPQSPAQSLLVYDTDLNGFYFYNSGTWYSLNEWAKTDASNNVSLNGNATISGSLSTASITNTGGLTTITVSASTSVSTSSISSNSISNSGSITTGSLSSTGAVSGGSINIAGFANNALVPSGAILMWSGSIASIPSGWALCDGNNGTPNLRDRFIAGAGNSYVVGYQNGQDFPTIQLSQLPAHDHVMHGSGAISGSGGPYYLSGNNGAYSGGGGDAFGRSNSPDSNLKTGSTGGGASFDNRPQFYALAYIMKL